MKKINVKTLGLCMQNFFLVCDFPAQDRDRPCLNSKDKVSNSFLFGKNTLFSIMSKNGIICEYEK